MTQADIKIPTTSQQPDSLGRFGKFGGKYPPRGELGNCSTPKGTSLL